MKPTVRTAARAEITGGGPIPKRSLADKINEMDPAEREDFQNQMKKAFLAKTARSEDSAHLPCKVYSKLNGGRCTDSDGRLDSGCTNPIITREVTEDLKIKLSPIINPLTIIQADGSALKVIGSSILFLEAENLKGRRMIECAVIEGNGARELLIS